MGKQGKTQRSEAQEKLWASITKWILDLQEYPGWKEWKRKQLGYTLLHDNELAASRYNNLTDFNFSDEIEKQHAVITKYLALLDTATRYQNASFTFVATPFAAFRLASTIT